MSVHPNHSRFPMIIQRLIEEDIVVDLRFGDRKAAFEILESLQLLPYDCSDTSATEYLESRGSDYFDLHDPDRNGLMTIVATADYDYYDDHNYTEMSLDEFLSAYQYEVKKTSWIVEHIGDIHRDLSALL